MDTQQSYHRDNLKEELIKSGLKLLNDQGYNNFSLRKVAKMCGVSQTAPYRHFKNKDDLIVSITSEVIKQFEDTLKSAALKYPEDLKNQINEMGFLYVKFFVENPEYLQLLFLSKDIKYIQENLSSSYTFLPPFETFFNTIQKYCLKNNIVSDIDIHTFALSHWSLVHGLAILISRNDYPYKGDYMELVRKIIWFS